ncbi:META domain-containing protein [Streptomyces sp. SID5785]|uniref:META domain-containing protein n=1 Tax=Streptomyces sp. SID5785 TaxID=2690309 RepID=UPI0013612187|nr:META domain-containing protein [Streptomyces sp. SID5785]MZD07258.1 META domain-containing protein [Streptomyces sp. SID5785]
MFTRHSTRGPRLPLAAVLPLAALGAVTACGTQQAGTVTAGGTQLTGVHWSVDTVTVDGRPTKAPGGAYVEFVSDERVRGNYGCNHFDADARVDGDSVDLGRAQVTEMYCSDARQRSFEKTLARALGERNTVKAGARGDTLTLTRSGGDTVTLVKRRDTALFGTKWQVTGVMSEGTTSSLPKAAQGRARLVFDKDGHVDARLGCNTGRAKATVRDDRITFGPLTSTRMGCFGPAAEVEKTLRAVLTGEARYTIRGDSLTLEPSDGKGPGVSLTAP